ncbi:UNVERIFIED_CONTAM: hypothetical protein FKN15_074940 [Acipenser sinensis]
MWGSSLSGDATERRGVPTPPPPPPTQLILLTNKYTYPKKHNTFSSKRFR